MGTLTRPPARGARLKLTPRHYVAIDGGSGAHLLAALMGCYPYIRQVASSRHADVLLVIEPVSEKLTAAVVELARALPRPARVLIVGAYAPTRDGMPESASIEQLLPGARRISSFSIPSVLEAILSVEQAAAIADSDRPGVEETTIQLPQKQEQEMATELAVLSLGPLQPLSAGPLRLLLICDGEQVLSVQVEAGYAYRGIAQAMLQADWGQALRAARQFDPLAPLAGQLAYVTAIEQLQGWQAPRQVEKAREAALALERVENALWWLTRFANVLADAALSARSYRLAAGFADHLSRCWQQSPSTWILPQYAISLPVVAGNTARLGQLAIEIDALKRQLERNRLLALRTRGIGVLAAERLEAAGVSGPVLTASQRGTGDIQSRLVARLVAAASDLRMAVEILAAGETVPARGALWDVPAGLARVTVRGPRGEIGLRLESSGGEQPANVEWLPPSAALLSLLPDILAGETLADAEALVASLDLAMAEADG